MWCRIEEQVSHYLQLYLLSKGGKVMEVYVVVGGCAGDEHIIAIYKSEKKAEKRVEKENKECEGLRAYIQVWPISK